MYLGNENCVLYTNHHHQVSSSLKRVEYNDRPVISYVHEYMQYILERDVITNFDLYCDLTLIVSVLYLRWIQVEMLYNDIHYVRCWRHALNSKV